MNYKKIFKYTAYCIFAYFIGDIIGALIMGDSITKRMLANAALSLVWWIVALNISNGKIGVETMPNFMAKEAVSNKNVNDFAALAAEKLREMGVTSEEDPHKEIENIKSPEEFFNDQKT